MNSIAVLIDTFTKATVDTVTFDMLSKHASVITDIKELSDDLYKSDVVIFEPALSVIVTPEILKEMKDRFQLSFTIIYQNDNLICAYRGLCNTIKAYYKEISWNLVYGAVHSDLAILEPYQKSEEVIDNFKAFRSRFPSDVIDYIERFYGTYLNLLRVTDEVVLKNSQLTDLVDVQSKIGKRTIAGITELKGILEEMQRKIYGYEALLSDTQDKVFGGFYPERPKVLYIKQISHVSGMDTLLSILFTVFKEQYKASCKVIKLVDSSSAKQLRYIPNNYEMISGQFNTGDILRNDFLVKLGVSDIMWDTLMLNRSGLEYLIVHDMRGVMDYALDKHLVTVTINEMSFDYAILGEYDNVLSSSPSNSVEYVWDYREVQKHTGSKIIRLTGHPTITAILDALQ